MADDLRQLYTEGKKIRRGPVRVVDISGNKPGEYGRYAGNTVVPRSTDSGRFENGTVFPKVVHRQLNEKFQIEREDVIMPHNDIQPKFDEQPGLDNLSMVGTPAGYDEEAPDDKAARIRQVIEEDNEVEERLALENRIREEVRAKRAAQQRAARPPTVSMAQYDPPPQPDLFTEMKSMMTDMFSNFQEQLDDIRNSRGVVPPAAGQPKPRPKTKDGMTNVAFTGDFGTIRAAFKTVSVAEECVVLGVPEGELQSYDPPVDSQKVLKLKVDEDLFYVVNAGLSFEYKGDRLTVLLRDNAHGNT